MKNNTKTNNDIRLKYPLTVVALEKDTYRIRGKTWYLHDKYLSEMGLSPKSNLLPYLHVKNGIAESIKILGCKLFRPIEKNTK